MAELTIAELITLVREQADDTVEPYLIPEYFIIQSIDEAQQQFVEDAIPLTQEFTIAVTAGTALYPVDELLMKPRFARSSVNKNELQFITLNEIDTTSTTSFSSTAWRDTTGTPRAIITDELHGYWRLYPIPVLDDTITVNAFYLPEPITSSTDDLSIPARWHPALVLGVLARLYGLQDSEVYDPKLQQQSEARWMYAIARARSLIERDVRGPGVVTFNRNGVW